MVQESLTSSDLFNETAMKNTVNPYLILKISQNASKDQIKKSFLSLARKYHPDKNKGNKLAERRFQQINMAYQLLSDPEQRKSFDQAWAMRESVTQQASQKKPPVGRSVSREHSVYPRQEKPIDLAVSFPVSLEDLCQSKPLSLNYVRPCNSKKEKSTLSLRIPQGMSPGRKLMFKGRGGGNGKKVFGDLYIEITLKPHTLFNSKGKDVFFEFPLSFLDAILLKEVKVPTVYGQVLLQLPEDILSSRLLRLKGMGLPINQKGDKGDMFVKFIVEFPKGMEQDLYKEFPTLRKLPQEQIMRLCKSYENQEELFPKSSLYKSLFVSLLKERKETG